MNRSSFMNDDSDSLPKYKIIILGKSSSGKTKLLTRYHHNFYQDSGVCTMSIDYNIKKRPHAFYWYYDTAGQQNFRSIVDHYYKGSDACIIVYDVSSSLSFDQIPYYYNKIKELTEDSLIYIIGCKSDLQKKITQDDLGKKYKGIRHFVTSAKTNQGVKQAFEAIQQELLKKQPMMKANNKVLNQFDFDRNSQVYKQRKKQKERCCS